MKKLTIALVVLLFTGVAFGQSLKKGGVIALHRVEITLAPGVTMDQYLDFWKNKIIPEASKVFPNTTFQMLKGIGENNQHQYGQFYHWESYEAFRSYWNDDGTTTEKGAAAMAKLQPLLEQLSKLGTYTQVPGDWLILTE